MKPTELLRRLNRLAAKRNLPISITEGGNHTKLRLGDRVTVIGRHNADLKTGTLRGTLKQLGLTQADLED
jgi:mRNA interferase HicA